MADELEFGAAATSYPPALGDVHNACLRQHIIDDLFDRQI